MMERPLRILMVNRNCRPAIGGIQTFLDTLGVQLIQMGIDVTVATTRMRRPPAGIPEGYRVAWNPGWREMMKLLRWATVVQFSCFDYRWWLAASTLHKPTVFIYHSHSRVCPKGVAWNGFESCSFKTHWRSCLGCMRRERSWIESAALWVSHPIKQWLVDRSAAVVTISRYMEQRFKIARSRTILMGIDRARFVPGQRPARTYLLFVGRLIPEKGCAVLLEAFAQCVQGGLEIPLMIVGDGPFRGELERRARDLGLNGRVSFLGAQSGSALVERIQEAVAVIVPSIGPEGWPRTPLEAMACGTPVVVASSGGLEEVGEAALRYPRLDRDALARHLLEVSTNPRVREQLVALGRVLAEQHDVRRMAGSYREVYRELVGGRGGPAVRLAGRNGTADAN